MKSKKLIWLVLCILIAFFSYKTYNLPTKAELGSYPIIHSKKKLLKCNYYDDRKFRISLDNSESVSLKNTDIKGGIVPHHLLADSMVASFFKTISSKQPEILVVIAPNHVGAGVRDIHTGSWDWDSPFGILQTDKEIVNYLIDTRISEINFELLEKEHSISSLVPYIKYFMPDTKIVPILISGTYDMNEAIDLSRSLERQLHDKDYLVIASVDFSHYLSIDEADKMDEITIKALTNRDLKQISWMNNDNVDSPPSIITLLTIMNELKVDNQTILEHNNSARISGRDEDCTTSYFTVVYWR